MGDRVAAAAIGVAVASATAVEPAKALLGTAGRARVGPARAVPGMAAPAGAAPAGAALGTGTATGIGAANAPGSRDRPGADDRNLVAGPVRVPPGRG
ncbi:MAG TPA: hypothetical protein VIX85_10170, partial [Acidimicrobiales bacterium]